MFAKKNMLAVAVLGLVVISGTAWAAEHGDAPHWTYEGHSGPANWSSLSEGFKACNNGAMQSPIDLSGGNMWDTVSVQTNYKPTELNILHNGHTVEFMVGNGSTMTSHGKTYHLLQIHFHTPSEHVVNGKHFPMEAHFVHAADDGSLAVIGVFFQEGGTNGSLKPVFDNLPTQPTEAAKKGVQISPSAVLPATSGFYRYMGSLTTPPCSEGVNWFLLKKPATASKAQLDAMHAALGDNARPAQPQNNRLLLEAKY